MDKNEFYSNLIGKHLDDEGIDIVELAKELREIENSSNIRDKDSMGKTDEDDAVDDSEDSIDSKIEEDSRIEEDSEIETENSDSISHHTTFTDRSQQLKKLTDMNNYAKQVLSPKNMIRAGVAIVGILLIFAICTYINFVTSNNGVLGFIVISVIIGSIVFVLLWTMVGVIHKLFKGEIIK